jgi:hypothetical protein
MGMATYKCEIEGCPWEGVIRSKVKNRESEYYGKKVCPKHAQEYKAKTFKNWKPLKRSEIKKSGKPIKRVTDKTREKRKAESIIRAVYFDYHVERCKRSEESGTVIPQPTRANICHIFPKRKYKSIQADLTNCVYLTLEEHTKFDMLLDIMAFEQLEKFKCWETVIERVQWLLPKIQEQGKLKTAFETYLKNRL